MAIDPRNLFPGARAVAAAAAAEEERAAPLDGTRAERVQRVQIGVFGLVAMLLLVGLADIVITRAQETQAASVPEAAPTTAPIETPAPRDPLADAGVVPELPPEPEASASPNPQPNVTDDVPLPRDLTQE